MNCPDLMVCVRVDVLSVIVVVGGVRLLLPPLLRARGYACSTHCYCYFYIDIGLWMISRMV